jgi:hypothetical protein
MKITPEIRLLALVLATAALAGCNSQSQSSGTSGAAGPATITMLGDSAPALPDFGPNTTTNAFGTGVQTSDAYSWPDGTTVVVRDDVEPPGSQTHVYSLELLKDTAFTNVVLPAAQGRSSGYDSISLGCGSVGEDPIACFTQDGGTKTYFVVKRNGLGPIASARGKKIDDDWTLANGETCTAEGPNDASSTGVWAIDKQGHSRLLVTGEALDKVSGMSASALIKSSDVRCGHVGDVDLLSISAGNADGAVYVVTRGVPTIAGRGAILTSGATQALIGWNNAYHARFEYTEVIFRKK